MRNKLDLLALENHFNYIHKQIAESLFPFSPNAKRLCKELNSYFSSIEVIKDISYSFKLDIEDLKKNYRPAQHILSNINELVFDLEIDLVNLSKYTNKIETLKRWFNQFSFLKSFIVENSSISYSTIEDLPEEIIKESNSEAKVIKFSHLL